MPNRGSDEVRDRFKRFPPAATSKSHRLVCKSPLFLSSRNRWPVRPGMIGGARADLGRDRRGQETRSGLANAERELPALVRIYASAL